MKLNIAKELAVLEQMAVGQLQQRYVEVFGEPVRSRHKQYLIRRIAWRLQANAEGGLSERALRRAKELANVADVRVTPPKIATGRATATTGRMVFRVRRHSVLSRAGRSPFRKKGRSGLSPPTPPKVLRVNSPALSTPSGPTL